MIELNEIDREQIEVSNRIGEDIKTDKSILYIKNTYYLHRDYDAAYLIYKTMYEYSRMGIIIDDNIDLEITNLTGYNNETLNN